MMKYEFRKTIYYNKGWILILLVFVQLFISSSLNNTHSDSLNDQNYSFYHQQLQGPMNEEKENFIFSEEQLMVSYENRREILIEDFKNDRISDEHYIKELKDLNLTHYKARVFEGVKEYIQYLEENPGREYIHENHINKFLSIEIPYLLIAVLILNVTTSFENEEPMESLRATSVVGRNSLMSTKLLSLMIINLGIFTLYFIISFLLRYDLSLFSELFASSDSTRMFSNTDFTGLLGLLVIIMYMIQSIGVILLTGMISLLHVKIGIKGLKLFILSFGIYVVSFFLFADSKALYYIPFIGFFNPIRYFVTNNSQMIGADISGFSTSELLVTISLSIFVITMMLFKRKSLNTIMIFVVAGFLLSGCTSSIKSSPDIEYSNHNNSIHCNDLVCVSPSDNILFDRENDNTFQINRNPLLPIDFIGVGTMYREYFYFIEEREGSWSLQKLNTLNFEQNHVYADSQFRYNIFGKLISTEFRNTPHRIYVAGEDIYLMFEDHVSLISNQKNHVNIMDEGILIISIEDENMYFINDQNQLEVFNLNNRTRTVILDSLVLSAQMDEEYIYYNKLKDETLHRFDRINHKSEQIVDEFVNFYQYVDGFVYYTSQYGNGIKVHSIDDGSTTDILTELRIYSISIVDDIIFFTADDEDSKKIISFYYKNGIIEKFAHPIE